MARVAEGYEHEHEPIPAWDQAFENAGGLGLEYKRTSGERVYHLVRAWFRAGYEAGARAAPPTPASTAEREAESGK